MTNTDIITPATAPFGFRYKGNDYTVWTNDTECHVRDSQGEVFHTMSVHLLRNLYNKVKGTYSFHGLIPVKKNEDGWFVYDNVRWITVDEYMELNPPKPMPF